MLSIWEWSELDCMNISFMPSLASARSAGLEGTDVLSGDGISIDPTRRHRLWFMKFRVF
jgi:hypothetical protein